MIQFLVAFGIVLCAACLGVGLGYLIWITFFEDD